MGRNENLRLLGSKRRDGVNNMRIFGISLGTILFVLILVFIIRKFGNDIPLVNKIG